MNIRTRIWLLGALAISGMIVLFGSQIIPPYRSMMESQELIKNLETADISSQVVHELQKERGLSAAHLTIGDQTSLSALKTQRLNTDEALRKVMPRRLPGSIDKLGSIRHKVAEQVVSDAASFSYYTDVIRQILEHSVQSRRAVVLSEQRRALDAHTNLMYAKEYLGELRAEIVRVVASPVATNKWAVLTIGKLFGQFERHLAQFQLIAGEADRVWIEAVMTSEDMDKVNSYLVAAVDDLLAGRASTMRSEQWFSVATHVIDSLHQLEQDSLLRMREAAQQSASAAKRHMVLLGAGIILLALLALVLATSSIRRVAAAFRALLESLEKISRHSDGEIKVAINRGGAAEISHNFDEMLEMVDRLTSQASTDQLTGAANRYSLQKYFEAERQRVDRYGRGFSLIMADVDHFKSINDQYGHAAGDLVLQSITKLLRDNLRVSDVLARWGGEEFAILIPERGSQETASIAEKLRLALVTHHFENMPSVSASFGVAEYRKGDSLEALCERADGALYAAKHAGRNKVCLADTKPEP